MKTTFVNLKQMLHNQTQNPKAVAIFKEDYKFLDVTNYIMYNI